MNVEPGMLVVQLEGDLARIIQADPVIRVAASLIEEIANTPPDPVEHFHPWHNRGIPRPLTSTLRTDLIQVDGDVLTVRDDFGAYYVYRLDEYDLQLDAYLARWPD